MKEVFEKLLECCLSAKPCMLVSAVGGEGSAPRKTQAHMLVDESGRICGTVGGGAVEGHGIELAKNLIIREESCVKAFELHENSSASIGMICGGRVNLHFLYIPPRDTGMIEMARYACKRYALGLKTWLSLGLNTHSIRLFDRDYSESERPMPFALDPRSVEPAFVEVDGETYYTEVLVKPGRVYIFGGGHVAQALVPVLASVDFRCVVVEDRAEFCNSQLFPLAESVRLVGMEAWKTELQITEDDRICIMTRNHHNDLECQAFALRTPASYIGVIGSRKKIAAVNDRLRQMGYTQADIDRIVTPIGLDIGAATPAEIAVSIAAQLIMHRSSLAKKDDKTASLF